MTSELPEIKTDQLELLCWHSWYNCPLSGLLLWQSEIFWFAHTDRWGVDDETGTWDDEWGYIYGVFPLTDAQTTEAVEWFKEKTDWFENRRFHAEGKQLRDWNGPKPRQPAIATFTDQEGLKGGGRECYGLPADFKIPQS